MKVARILAVIAAAVTILVFAGWLRTTDEGRQTLLTDDPVELGDRPMHGDEAVNAFKFRALYEANAYAYDPTEYHGPTLPYLTLLAAWAHAESDWVEFDAAFYRSVTIAAGVLLVAVTVLMGLGVGWLPAILAAMLVAVSPAMVFYSRYYIHEMPMVLFTAGAIFAGWRYARTGGLAWAIGLGAGLALMHATKETAIVAWFAAAVATLLMLAFHHRRELNVETVTRLVRTHAKPAGWALLVWVIIAVVLFSSFFTHWRGPLDSVLTFLSYADRGTTGEPAHIHPWHYYLGLLWWHQPIDRLLWTEALTLSLAAVGLLAAAIGWGIPLHHRPFVRWLAVYTVTLVVVFSAIPYKTPWNVLIFMHPIMLLAGVGAAWLAWGVPRGLAGLFMQRPAWVATPFCVAALLPFVVATWDPFGWVKWDLHSQAQTAISNRFDDDRRNPWVYAHPGADVVALGEQVVELASLHPMGMDTPVLVFDAGNNWPLPWYLRRLNNVGYYRHAPPEDVSGPIILIEGTLDHEARLVDRLGETHARPRVRGIRPEYFISIYARQDLMEAYIDRRR